MSMTIRAAILIAALVGARALTAPLAAQQSVNRTGLWMGAGAGLGWARVHCRICRANRGHSLSADARLGGRLSNHVLVGGEVQAWFKNGDPEQDAPADELLLAYSGVFYWYPSNRYAYYLKAGLGLVTYRIADSTDRLTSSALGPQIGVGWELPVGRHFSAVPYLNVLVGSIGSEVKFNGTEVLGSAALGLLQLGVGISRR